MSDTENAAIAGGCLCGAVRYEITGEPTLAGKCYCDDCRRWGSTGHAALLGVPTSAFSVTGEVKGYTSTGGSGQPITRYFCPTCGSQIYGHPQVVDGLTMVRASSLDDPERFQPKASIFVSRAPSWDQPQPGDVTFEEGPPSR